MQSGPSAASRRSQLPRTIRNQSFHTHSTRPDKPVRGTRTSNTVGYIPITEEVTGWHGAGTNLEKPSKAASPECNSGLSQTTGNCQGKHSDQGNVAGPSKVGADPCVRPPGEIRTRKRNEWNQLKHSNMFFLPRKTQKTCDRQRFSGWSRMQSEIAAGNRRFQRNETKSDRLPSPEPTAGATLLSGPPRKEQSDLPL